MMSSSAQPFSDAAWIWCKLNRRGSSHIVDSATYAPSRLTRAHLTFGSEPTMLHRRTNGREPSEC